MSLNADVKQRVRVEKRLQSLERAAARNGRFVLPDRLKGVLSRTLDANEMQGSGWFWLTTNGGNSPDITQNYIIEQYELDSTTRYQQAWRIGSPPNFIFAERWTRTRTGNGGWTAWKLLSYPTTSFTPTLTGMAQGNGTLSGTFSVADGIVTGRIIFVLGSTSGVSSDLRFSYPPFPYSGSTMNAGFGRLTDSSQGIAAQATVLCNSSFIYARPLAATTIDSTTQYLRELQGSASIPFAWGAGDSMVLDFSYPIV
ncbi:hypothetical protein HOT31_gp074 [Microbacterium phage Hendrix]|uniref:Minor tail protein n=1 Tax=Microbacterium phage Hendrix TaxID=2182341 RepID=A0A2U8UU68_9CAUD|nr:hypothetical protein HOT31_gp074 [Microbacterium phage Hendrix]AWN07745.1 hypothetical protein PBI_HENDRIX_74 [Microbacterium phage Hendrix]